MDTQSFYALMAGTCFGLVGLWWNVVRAKPEWARNEQLRTLASGVYLSFLIPGLMSLVAQVSGGSPLIWQVTRPGGCAGNVLHRPPHPQDERRGA